MKKLAFFSLLTVAFVLFQNSAWVKLTLVKPAQIKIPSHLKSLAVIDLTKQRESTQIKLEEVLTGELFQQDEQAAGKLLDGVINLCSGYKRYEIIRTGERLIGNGTKNVFPKPLEWSRVNSYCKKYNTDGILSIEILDSDFLVTNNPFEEKTKDKDGNEITITKYKAVGVAIINVGLRIYDPKSKQISDEYRLTERLNFNAAGNTVNDAINSLLDKTAAINKASYNAGYNYGKRISPYYYTVKREFFNKPKKSKYLQEGVRKSEVADWEGAIESWMKVFDSKDKKDKKAVGKAAFNIAVAYEVLGNYEKAKEWASKAHVEYEEDEGTDYYKKIQYRIREEAILKAQLGE